VQWLAGSGKALPAGSVVMTGGLTEAITVSAGDHVAVRVQHLGTVGVRFA
jgi:2-oxo-3-hexenedioate decarboxylase